LKRTKQFSPKVEEKLLPFQGVKLRPSIKKSKIEPEKIEEMIIETNKPRAFTIGVPPNVQQRKSIRPSRGKEEKIIIKSSSKISPQSLSKSSILNLAPKSLVVKSPPKSLVVKSPPKSLVVRSPPKSLVVRSPPKSLVVKSPPKSLVVRSPPKSLVVRSPPKVRFVPPVGELEEIKKRLKQRETKEKSLSPTGSEMAKVLKKAVPEISREQPKRNQNKSPIRSPSEWI